MPIPNSFIDDLVRATDIADLVSNYVKLTKRSGSNDFGLCPFHSEKTPSFSVNADKQIYYCFGCQKGGGVINFVMEIENLPFRDAIEVLARQAGMNVPEESASANELAGKRRRMLELNRDAARHFHEMLSSPISQSIRDYLVHRQLSKTVLKKFGIGAAPDSWTLLLDAMSKKGYGKQELIEAGLVRSGQQDNAGLYDVFRNRLMFPIIDVRGDVIGFSGRIIGDGEPKYLNSPETIVFSKSKNLFGLNLAKNSKNDTLILAEGNMDVVMLHQFGFNNAVASLGTSLTPDQSRLMSRYASYAIIAFDSDEAGKRATMRAIPLLENAGMNIKIIDMGDSKDPDDFLKKKGKDAFDALIENSENHIEYRLRSIEKSYDISTTEGRLAYVAAAVALLSELESRPEREVYGAQVARTANISVLSIEQEVEKKIRLKSNTNKNESKKRSAIPPPAKQDLPEEAELGTQHSVAAEESLVRSLIRDPSFIKTVEEIGFSQEEFTSELLSKTYDILLRRISQGNDIQTDLVMSELNNDDAAKLMTIMQKTHTLPLQKQSIIDYVERIRSEKYKTVNPDNASLLEIKSFREKKDIGGY